MVGVLVRYRRLAQVQHGVPFDGHAKGLLDGTQAGGDTSISGGDGLAVVAAIGAFWQCPTVAFYLADVSLQVVGMRGDSEDGDASGGGIKDEADGLVIGALARYGDEAGSLSLRPNLPWAATVYNPFAEVDQHRIGPVYLVTGGAEILADRAAVGAAVDAVPHKSGSLRLVRISPGAGMDAQLSFERPADRSGPDEPDQGTGEDRRLGPSSQPDG